MQPAGSATVCDRLFVVVRPYPLSQANRVPPCAACPENAPITPEEAVHGVEPDSKPGLPSFWPGLVHWPGVPPVTVSWSVVVRVTLPVPVIVTLNVPDGVVAAVVMVRVDEPPAVTEAGLNDAAAPRRQPTGRQRHGLGRAGGDRGGHGGRGRGTGGRRYGRWARPRSRSRCPAWSVQVGSPDWAGTATAFQARWVRLNTVQSPGNRFLAAFSEATRTLT